MLIGTLNPFGTLSIAFDEQVNTADAAAAAPTAELDDDEADEYNESSDEEVEDRPDDSTLLQERDWKLCDVSPGSTNSLRKSCPFQ